MKNSSAKIQPWIQAFTYRYKKARISFQEYIERQINAAENTGARGWVAWNAAGKYNALFKALESINKKKRVALREKEKSE